METSAVATPDATLAYRRRGRRGAPVLLLLHGITDGAATWDRVASELEDAFDLVIPDARGHGDSSRTAAEIDIATLAGDAAALLDALGLAKVAVWGHSMGAATGAALAASRPELVRALVLEDPPYRADDPEGPLDATPASSPEPDVHLQAFLALLVAMREMTPAERLAIARRDNPTWDPAEQGPWAETKAAFDPAFSVPGGLGRGWRRILEAVAVPTLLVTGDPERGGIVTPDVAAEAVALLSHGEAVRIVAAGHSVHRDAFDDTLDAARAFLAQAL